MIGKDGERVAGGDVLATFDGEVLENEGDLGVRAGGRRGRGRCPDDDLPQQRPLQKDLVDLGFGEPVEQECLTLGGADGFELLKLILPLEDRLDRHDPLRADSLQAADLPTDDIDLLGRFQEVGLGLDKLLVGQSDLKEGLIRGHGFPFGREDLGHRSGDRRDDRELRSPAAFDHDPRHADRQVERRKRDIPFPQADATAGLIA